MEVQYVSYRPDDASENPKDRLAEGPQRTHASLRGTLLVIALVCVLLIIFILLLSWR